MKNRQRQKDILFSILIFGSAFAVNLLIQKLFTTQTLVPMIFVFGVFLISLKTHGYCYGIISAIVSVFAVNFAFTYPYYAFDFFVEESILSAVIMLVVAVSTSTLNIRILHLHYDHLSGGPLHRGHEFPGRFLRLTGIRPRLWCGLSIYPLLPGANLRWR